MSNSDIFPNHKTVYGPVKSWRYGQSLGIDPIFHTSTCSFNCIYCQLGQIQKVTRERKIYVETQRVLNDFLEVINNAHVDVITYSGSGEPTLASNLEEIIDELTKVNSKIPQGILTNGTELHIPEVQRALTKLDQVTVKLDSLSPKVFNQINRPDPEVELDKIIAGILEFNTNFSGELNIQTMFMPLNTKDIQQYADIVNKINPSSLQLNTPKRPYPLSWHRENRGNHLLIFDYEVKEIKALSHEQAKEIENRLKQLTDVPISSIYN